MFILNCGGEKKNRDQFCPKKEEFASEKERRNCRVAFHE